MNYNYIQTFRWIYSRLQPHRKKQFWLLFAGMSFAALLETIALGAVAFVPQAVQAQDEEPEAPTTPWSDMRGMGGKRGGYQHQNHCQAN